MLASWGHLLVAVLLSSLQGTGGAPADGRLAVPDPAATERAEQLVREIYKDDLASPTLRQLEILARALLKRSREYGTDPATRFALITLARDLALEAGDAETALTAVDELGGTFRIDAEATRLRLLESIAAKAKTPAECQLCFDDALSGIERALQSHRWSGAQLLLDFTDAIASRCNDPAVPTIAARLRAQARELEAGEPDYLRARSLLEHDSTDRSAHAIVGRYQCFLHGDWAQGLSHLVMGDDAAIATVAGLELKLPEEAPMQIAVADGWWAIAGRATPGARPILEVHAASWYRRALPELQGVARARAAARLSELEPPPPMPKKPPKIDPDDWVLRRRTADHWKSEPLAGIFNRLSAGIFRVRNTASANEGLKIAFSPTILDGNFKTWLEYRGQLKTVELCAEDGTDRQLYIEDLPSDRTWHLITITRTRAEVRAWVDGNPLPIRDYNAGPLVPAIFSLRADSGCEVEVRTFTYQGGRSR